MLSITENDFIGFELLFHDAKMTFFGNVFNKQRNNLSAPILKKIAIHAFEPLDTPNPKNQNLIILTMQGS